MQNLLKDVLEKGTKTLPPSTSAVALAAFLDTRKVTSSGNQLANVEFKLSAPLVTTAQLPDTKTFTYDILHSDNADGSSSSILMQDVIVQTGAGGAGAAAATLRFKIPSDAKRYIGFNVTPSGSGTGDASAASATLEALF